MRRRRVAERGSSVDRSGARRRGGGRHSGRRNGHGPRACVFHEGSHHDDAQERQNEPPLLHREAVGGEGRESFDHRVHAPGQSRGNAGDIRVLSAVLPSSAPARCGRAFEVGRDFQARRRWARAAGCPYPTASVVPGVEGRWAQRPRTRTPSPWRARLEKVGISSWKNTLTDYEPRRSRPTARTPSSLRGKQGPQAAGNST
jgi:hypothetical protein